jgi:hypothetical protein
MDFTRKDTEVALREIGEQLDSFSFVYVKNGGLVVPSGPALLPRILGTEKENGKSRETRSETGPRAGTPAWQGSAFGPRAPGDGSRPPGETASVVGAGVREIYEDELNAVQRAYPGTQHWMQDDGMWVLAESSLLPGFFPKANFLVGISFANRSVRSWGFWGASAIGYSWIGPRHTNFPDGSICAFEQQYDRTWLVGDPLIDLLDLYTLWAVRHLHLRDLGRWPGYQAVPHAYERILELKENEHCGCQNSHKLYGECCRNTDLGGRGLAPNRLALAIDFTFRFAGGLRKPPAAVLRFLRDRVVPPSFSNLF